MGSPKEALDWHGSTLLRRVTGVLARSVSGGPVIVVRAAGQALPALPAGVEVVADSAQGRGPLQGLAAGLTAADDRANVAYVSSVDAPLLEPAFVRRVTAALSDRFDAAVPEIDGRRHPLAGAYRVSVLGLVNQLLSEDRLAMGALLDRCRLRVLAGPELPRSRSLMNLNDRDAYTKALGLPAPAITVNGSTAHAWRLADVLSGGLTGGVRLNGEPVDPDPELPLVAGDVVAFA